jgi:hypothetical protein
MPRTANTNFRTKINLASRSVCMVNLGAATGRALAETLDPGVWLQPEVKKDGIFLHFVMDEPMTVDVGIIDPKFRRKK